MRATFLLLVTMNISPTLMAVGWLFGIVQTPKPVPCPWELIIESKNSLSESINVVLKRLKMSKALSNRLRADLETYTSFKLAHNETITHELTGLFATATAIR